MDVGKADEVNLKYFFNIFPAEWSTVFFLIDIFSELENWNNGKNKQCNGNRNKQVRPAGCCDMLLLFFFKSVFI